MVQYNIEEVLLMFKFKRVEITNFKSLQHAALDLDNKGLVLVEGINNTNSNFTSNGAGKSTIFDAITWALYDTTPTGIKADKVVNKQVGKNTHVMLQVEVDGTSYAIDRYRKHSKFKNTVRFHQGTLDLTQKSVSDTNDRILALFGIDFKTYLNSIMYGQGDIELFSQATDKGKKEILENVSNIAIYQKAQQVAKEKLAECTTQQRECSTNIAVYSQQIEKFTLLANAETARYTQAKSQKESLSKQLRTLEETIENTQAYKIQSEVETNNLIKTLQEKLVQAKLAQKKAIVESAQSVENQKNHVASLVIQIGEYPGLTTYDDSAQRETIKDLEDKLQKLKIALGQKQAEIQTLKNSLQSLDVSDTCAYCGAPIDNSHKVAESARIHAEISAISKMIAGVPVAIQTVTTAIATTKKEIEEGRAKVEASKADFYTLKDQKAVEDRKLQTLQHEAQNIQNNRIVADIEQEIAQKEQSKLLSPYAQKLLTLKGQKEELTRSIQSFVITEPNLYTTELEETNTLLADSKAHLTELHQEQDKYTSVINNVFSNSGIRSVVLDLVTPFLNETANNYLSALSGSSINIEFSTQAKKADGTLSDKFDVVVTNSTGGEDYSSNSAGEKKRIDLAIALAIQDLVMSKSNLQTNLVLYDECFDGLDTVGCENMVAILQEKQKTIPSIFVITHNEHLKSLFENVLTVHKEDGVSTIEGGDIK